MNYAAYIGAQIKIICLGHHVFEKGILDAREGNYALRLYIPHPPAIITCVSLHSQEYCTPSGICAGHFTPKRYTCLPFHVLAISRACHFTRLPFHALAIARASHAVYVLATARRLRVKVEKGCKKVEKARGRDIKWKQIAK